MESPSLEYTMESTSREEGVVVDVPLLPSNGSNATGASSRRYHRGGSDSPFDEAHTDLDLLVASSEGTTTKEGNNDAASRTTIRSAAHTSSVSLNQEMRRMTLAMQQEGTDGSNDSSNDINDTSDKPSAASPSSSPIPSYYTAPPTRRSFLPSPLSFAQKLREYRHNNCIMTPLSAFVLLALILSSCLTLLLTVPQFLLGILLGPLLKRNFWLVEFLYRYNIAKWGHLKIMEMAGKAGRNDKGKKGKSSESSDPKKLTAGHSQTIQQRITVVPDRVYIHPIPQFMDNIAYLIVCLPPPDAPSLPLIAILIDCGEAHKVLHYMEQIYQEYYIRDYPRDNNNQKRQSLGRESSAIQVQHRSSGSVGMELHAILCTHRHHDHTAGVGDLQKELTRRRPEDGRGDGVLVDAGCRSSRISGGYDGDQSNIYRRAPGNVLVVGGAVEQVPHCNLYVKNGCFVPLPCISVRDETEDGAKSQRMMNDMNAIVSMEVIGVPSHTRGSVVYALRNRAAPGVVTSIGGQNDSSQIVPLQSHLFTGDAIFTGGGGVPFEANLEFAKDNFIKNPKSLKSKNGSSTPSLQVLNNWCNMYYLIHKRIVPTHFCKILIGQGNIYKALRLLPPSTIITYYTPI